MTTAKVQSLSSLAWSIAEILRGDFKQSEYGKVVLPFVVLRRLDCILESSKDAVISAYDALPEGVDDHTKDMMLFSAVGNGLKLYNVSKLTFHRIGKDRQKYLFAYQGRGKAKSHGCPWLERSIPAILYKRLRDFVRLVRNNYVREHFLSKA